MKLVATYKGEKYDVGNPTLKDFVFLERQFGVSAASVGDNPRMEYMIYLAYCSLLRQGVVNYRYSDAFLDELESVEDADADATAEGEAVDPTGPTQDPQPAH